jgi:hypothetical protein
MNFTAKDKRECAERELEWRRYCYPRWIAKGTTKMTQPKADREIAIMEAIVEDYKILEGGERLI